MSGSWVNLYAMLPQEFLERVPGRAQEIDIASLTSELEDRFIALSTFRGRHDGNLVIALDHLGK